MNNVKKKKIIFLFPNDRSQLIKDVKKSIAPDNSLYGFNHFGNGYLVEEATVSLKLERALNILLLPLSFWFNSRFTKLNLGRVLLTLPKLNKADVVVTCVDSINKAACLLKKLGILRQRLACTAGNVSDGTERWLYLHRWLWSGANVVVAHAPVDQEKLKHLGLVSKGVLIPVGSDQKFYQPKKTKIIQNLIVSVGADRDRDYRTMFFVARQLPNMRFEVFTRPGNIKDLIVPGNVKVFFNSSFMNTRKSLFKADVVVVPLKETHRASGQLALLDAMVMGKPIVVGAIRGSVEAYGLANMKQVLLVPPENIGSLVQAIEKLQSNRSLRYKLGIGGRKLAFRYTTKKYAEELKKVIFTSK